MTPPTDVPQPNPNPAPGTDGPGDTPTRADPAGERNLPSPEEWGRMEERLRALAREKSCLQLVNHLMSRLSAASGLEHTAENIVRLILDNLGGTNVALYFRVGTRWACVDVHSGWKALETIEDPMVRAAWDHGEYREETRDFADTRMTTPAFTRASNWALPLLAGARCVGVLKTEGMLMSMAESRRELHPFFSYAALVLNHEIESHLRLMEAGQWAAIVRFSNDAIVSESLDGIVLSWNKGAERIYGYSEAEAIGRHIAFLVPPDRGQENTDILASVGRGQAVENLETTRRRKDGELIQVSVTVSPLRDEAGNVASASVIARDITERKRAEQALRAASRYARNLIEASLDPLVTIDPDGRITDVNFATEQATGLAREQLIGTEFCGYFAEPDKARAGYRQVLAQGRVVDYPLTLRHVSGASVEVLYNAALYRDEEGRVAGVFAAARDVTALKCVEAEHSRLQARYHQLQKAESLGRMAGAIAHHFNNKLAAVTLNLDLALRAAPQTEASTGPLRDAIESARQASEISGLMLTYLGLSPGKPAPLDLAEACQRYLPLLRAALPEGVNLEAQLALPGPCVTADKYQIQQALSNLVTNAWEAMPDARGAIRLDVRVVPASEIAPTNRFPLEWQPAEGTFACLEIADTGSGIAEANLGKLFDPFFSSKFVGRGLGLPVVLGIVRGHNGGITVASQAGRGSAFRLFFPVLAEASPQRPPLASATPELREQGTLLLVEDEPRLRKVVATALGRLGFTVLSAADGQEALELFERHRQEVRLVLCDLTMPRMNGWETLVALRRLSPGLPVILSSGYNEAVAFADSPSEQPQAFLHKPYESQELAGAIRHVLAQSAV